MNAPPTPERLADRDTAIAYLLGLGREPRGCHVSNPAVAASIYDEMIAPLAAEVDRLRAENGRLRAGAKSLLAEVDRLRAQVEDFAGLLNRAAGEAERHALANDGCVPGGAYRDLGEEHRRVTAERDRLRAQVAAVYTWCDQEMARNGSTVALDGVLAALASGEQVQP